MTPVARTSDPSFSRTLIESTAASRGIVWPRPAPPNLTLQTQLNCRHGGAHTPRTPSPAAVSASQHTAMTRASRRAKLPLQRSLDDDDESTMDEKDVLALTPAALLPFVLAAVVLGAWRSQVQVLSSRAPTKRRLCNGKRRTRVKLSSIVRRPEYRSCQPKPAREAATRPLREVERTGIESWSTTLAQPTGAQANRRSTGMRCRRAAPTRRTCRISPIERER
jgi:hypothetical protein